MFERMAQDLQRPNREMSDIFVMRADGTDVHRISIGSELTGKLSWERSMRPHPFDESEMDVQVVPGAHGTS